MSQRHYRIEPGSTPGWHHAEEDADSRRNTYREGNCLETEYRRQAQELSQEHSANPGNRQSQQPTNHAKGDCFNQELDDYVSAGGPYCLGYTYLAGPLGHRDQHDIHDADAA